MTTQQIIKAGKSVSQSQVTELQTSANNISAIIDTLTLDPWQNLNAAITGIESQIDNNDASNADDSDRLPNSETDTDTEINNLVTDNNETPLLYTVSDPIHFIDPVDSSDDNTANTNSSDEVIDNTTDTTIEPTVKPNEPSAVDNTNSEIQIDEPLLDAVINDEMSDTPNSFEDQVTNADDGTSITDNSSEVIDNPEVVADIDNEIQIDEPLTDVVDVSDGPIMDDLVTLNSLDITNEPLGINEYEGWIENDEPLTDVVDVSDDPIIDGLVTLNSLGITNEPLGIEYERWIEKRSHTWIEPTFTLADIDFQRLIRFSDLETQFAFEHNINLNLVEPGDSIFPSSQFAADTVTTSNDEDFSNSDISVSGAHTSKGDSDAPSTYSSESITDRLNSIIKRFPELNLVIRVIEEDSTSTDTNTVDNEVGATSGGDVDLNSNFIVSGDSVATDETQPTLFSGDNMTAPNDDVFSNSDIPTLGILTSNEDSDVPLPDSADVTDKPIMEDLVTPDSLDITNEPLGISELENNSYKWTQPTFTFADIDFMRLITFSDMEVQAAVEYNINLNLVEPGDPIFTDRTQPTRFYTDFPGATLTSTQFSNTDTLSVRTLTFIKDHDDLLTDTVDVTDDSIVENLDITNEPLGMDNVDLAEFSSNEIEATSGGNVDLNSNFIESGDSVANDNTQPTLFSGDNMTAPNDDVFSASNPDIPVLGTLSYSADNSPFIQLIGNSEDINTEG